MSRWHSQTCDDEGILKNYSKPSIGNKMGTLKSLPGSVIYAGPKSACTRVIIFFTTAKMEPKIQLSSQEKWETTTPYQLTKNELSIYSNDNQFSKVTLFAEIIIKIWRYKDMDKATDIC